MRPFRRSAAFADGVRRRLQKRSLITIDKAGTIIGCNQAARDLFGYAVGTLIEKNVRILMPEPYASAHQSYVERYLASGRSYGAIGLRKERPALRHDGQPFQVRVSLSSTTHEGEMVFSALIDPVYECEIKTDDKDLIVAVDGSPWLVFGYNKADLVGNKVERVLRNAADWRGKVDKGERVVMCRNVEGDEFAVSLRMRKEGAMLVGKFSEAPALKMKIVMLKSGIIDECSGESKALIGYKTKSLKGMRLEDLLPDEEISSIALDTKTVISVKHRDGRTVFMSLRVTQGRRTDGTTIFEGILKGRQTGEVNLLKSKRLRYGGPVFGWYEMGPSLGHGMCGPVRRAVHRLTGEEVAIKTLSRERYRELNMVFPPQEIRLLERVRHPHLMRMLETIWTEDDIYLVLELIDGGEFFEYCSAAGRLNELLSGVDYLHRSMICHRDIKLENIVMDSNHNLKLVDFGFACSFYTGQKMEVFCGSPDYAAPELVGNESYFGPQVDIWAMGVVLYVMLTGFIPFSTPARCLALRWMWPPDMTVSPSLNSLVKALFQMAPARATMESLLTHEWTNAGGQQELLKRIEPVLGKPHQELHEDIVEEMEEHFGWTRDAVISALSAHHTPSQIATTYHLLEYKKQKAAMPKNPIWKVQGKGGNNVTVGSATAPTGRKKPTACVIA